MQIRFHKKFIKSFEKQPKVIQNKFKLKFSLFQNDQFHYSLNNHALTGEFMGTRSFNVTSDIRVHYEEVKDGIVLIDIGSHSQLY